MESGSSSGEDEGRAVAGRGSKAAPALKQAGEGQLKLGYVDPIHHTCQVQYQGEGPLPAASEWHCVFGQQRVPAEVGQDGVVCCYAPPPKV